MNAHERAARLFEAAEKLGRESPSEECVAEAINHAQECAVDECISTLEKYGLGVAVGVLERARKRRYLESGE